MARDTKVAPWEDIVLRVIAIYKILHGLFFIGIGVGLVKLKHKDIPQFLSDYVIRPLRLPPESNLVDWALTEAHKLTPHIIVQASDVVFFYALLFLIEGVGLYLRKHWAEYFVVIVTGSLLPFEIYAMCLKAEWWKAGLIVGNLLIFGYLIHRLWLDRHTRCSDSKKNEGLAVGEHRAKPRTEQHISNGRG